MDAIINQLRLYWDRDLDLERIKLNLDLERMKRNVERMKRKLQKRVERTKRNQERLERMKRNLERVERTIVLELVERIIDLERMMNYMIHVERVERMIVLELVERIIDLERMMKCMIHVEPKTDLERIKHNLEQVERMIDLQPSIDLKHTIDEFVRRVLRLGPEGRTALFGRERCSRLSRLVDVYIKDRYPLVKQILTTQLYDTLDQLDLRDFLENGLGNSFSSNVKIAIHSVKMRIAILSKTSECLRDRVNLLKMAEVVRMLESNCKSIPVFYHEELQKLRQRNCQMSKNPVGQGLHNQVKEFKRGRFGQLVQNLEKQCTLQRKKRRKP